MAEAMLLQQDDLYQLVIAMPLPLPLFVVRRKRTLVLQQQLAVAGLHVFLPMEVKDSLRRSARIAQLRTSGALPMVCFLQDVEEGVLLHFHRPFLQEAEVDGLQTTGLVQCSGLQVAQIVFQIGAFRLQGLLFIDRGVLPLVVCAQHIVEHPRGAHTGVAIVGALHFEVMGGLSVLLVGLHKHVVVDACRRTRVDVFIKVSEPIAALNALQQIVRVDALVIVPFQAPFFIAKSCAGAEHQVFAWQ